MEEHKWWFNEKCSGPNATLCGCEESIQLSGVVRFKRSPNRVLLNYLVVSEARGESWLVDVINVDR